MPNLIDVVNQLTDLTSKYTLVEEVDEDYCPKAVVKVVSHISAMPDVDIELDVGVEFCPNRIFEGKKLMIEEVDPVVLASKDFAESSPLSKRRTISEARIPNRFIWKDVKYDDYNLPFYANKKKPGGDLSNFPESKKLAVKWVTKNAPEAIKGLILAIWQHESNFNFSAKSSNSNGSIDWGIGQINDVSINFPGFKNRWDKGGDLFLKDPVAQMKLSTEMLTVFFDKFGEEMYLAPVLRRYGGGVQLLTPSSDYASVVNNIAYYADLAYSEG